MTNTNMKRGFTMIELIFVIVIIGILAAIALPKLNATRTDAKVANIVSNSKQLLDDVKTFYTSQGQTTYETNATISDITSVPVMDATCKQLDTTKQFVAQKEYICGDDGKVVEFDPTTDKTKLTIKFAGNPAKDVDKYVLKNKAFKAISNGTTGISHRLGGVGIKP